MLKIRLRRVGAKKQPSYRIVVAESTAPRDGKFVEIIGHYNPRTEPETVVIKEDRALYWLSVGAQPTDAVNRFFKRRGTWERLARLRAGESLASLVAEFEAASASQQAEVPVGQAEQERESPTAEEAVSASDEAAGARTEVEDSTVEEA